MSINFSYIQPQIGKKIQRIAPVTSIQKMHQNPFEKKDNNPKKQNQSDFQSLLDESMEKYQKGTSKNM